MLGGSLSKRMSSFLLDPIVFSLWVGVPASPTVCEPSPAFTRRFALRGGIHNCRPGTVSDRYGYFGDEGTVRLGKNELWVVVFGGRLQLLSFVLSDNSGKSADPPWLQLPEITQRGFHPGYCPLRPRPRRRPSRTIVPMDVSSFPLPHLLTRFRSRYASRGLTSRPGNSNGASVPLAVETV